MKSIAVIITAVFATVMFGSTAFSQIDDVPGWQEARWGMSESELLEVFKGRITKLPKQEASRQRSRW